MLKLNSQNERIKRDYLRFLKEARGKSEATLDTIRKALALLRTTPAPVTSRHFAASRRSASRIGLPKRTG